MKIVTSLGATPNRVQIIFEYLVRCPGNSVPRDVFAALVAPASLARTEEEDNAAFSDCVAAGVDLGLFRRDRDRIVLADAPPSLDCLATELRARLEQSLLNARISSADQEGAFSGAVAWMLCQDPFNGLGAKGSPAPITLFKDQIGDEKPDYDLTNNERFQQATYWARYFGFVSKLSIKDTSYIIPDPTEAMLRHLDAVLPLGTEKSVQAFMADFSKICPVLEGGLTRTEVEQRLRQEFRRRDHVLSRSTSLALLRLQKRGELSFRRLDDYPIVEAEGLLSDGRVTHVSRDGVGA